MEAERSRRELEKSKPYLSSSDSSKILFDRKKAISVYVSPEGNRERNSLIS